jgi:SAM-dependent methyltransferase
MAGLTRTQRAVLKSSLLLDRLGVAEQAFHAYERVRALSGRGGRDADGLPVPPSDLRYLVIGTTDVETFLSTGRDHAAEIRATLAGSGFEVADAQRLLDFGVGCGRIARHWAGAGIEVHGSDYNPRLVAWCEGNLPFVHAAVNGLAPPLRYEPETFDVIYAVSVLTHLPQDLQLAWMREWRRVLRPGGRLLVTIHGDATLDNMLPDERARYEAGELVVRHDRSAGSNLCVTYHPWAWVTSRLAEGFDVLSTEGDAPRLGNQDAVVLTPR